jgi:hypothetical protein
MRNLRTVAALLIGAVLCGSCAADESGGVPESQAETAAWQKWENPGLHYRIRWPDGWNNDLTRIGLYGMQRLVKADPPGAQVQVLQMPTGLLSGNKLAQVAAAMARANPAMAEKLAEAQLALDGQTGLAATYSGQQEGRAVKTLAHFISTQTGLFVVLGIMPADEAEIAAEWDEMARIVAGFTYDPTLQETAKPTEPEPETATPAVAGEGELQYTVGVPEGWREETVEVDGLLKQLRKADDGTQVVAIGHARVPQMAAPQLEEFVALNSLANPLLRDKLRTSTVVFSHGIGLVAAYAGSDGLQECRVLVKYISTPGGLFVVIGRAPEQTSEDDWQAVVGIVNSFQPQPPPSPTETKTSTEE